MTKTDTISILLGKNVFVFTWGSTSKTNLHKIQTKQRHVIRLIFFATLSGKNTDGALPLLNILEMLTVANFFSPACSQMSKSGHYLLHDRASKGYGSIPGLTSQTSLHACLQRLKTSNQEWTHATY